jgi:hypothetical protein
VLDFRELLSRQSNLLVETKPETPSTQPTSCRVGNPAYDFFAR